MGKMFKTVAVAGTFDELHKGHKALLAKAFEMGDHVLIGLCSDDFIKTIKKPHVTASYALRLNELRAFLRGSGFSRRATIIPLNDAFGPALTSTDIEALVVSRKTEPTAREINKKRKEAGLFPLEAVVIDLVSSEKNLPISTTRIRRGEIDREGHLLKTCPK
jgi:pantetheine-phosphate adenylyltransferase